MLAIELVEQLHDIPDDEISARQSVKVIEAVFPRRAPPGLTRSSQKVAVALRREALASLARTDLGRSVQLYQSLHDLQPRRFFSHSLLVAMVNSGWPSGEALSYLRRLDDGAAP